MDIRPNWARKGVRQNNTETYIDLAKPVKAVPVFALTALMANILVFYWMMYAN